MYLAKQLEKVRREIQHAGGWQTGWKVTFWRVDMDGNGILTWKASSEGLTVWVNAFRNDHAARRDAVLHAGRKDIPFITFKPGKVTMAQAAKLTGCLPPAALDYLWDHFDNRTDVVSNYRKPKKAKEPKAKPTPAQVYRQEESRAAARAEYYRRQSGRYARLAVKWAKREANAARAARNHEEGESKTNPNPEER